MTQTALWCALVILALLLGYATGRTDERNLRRAREYENERRQFSDYERRRHGCD